MVFFSKEVVIKKYVKFYLFVKKFVIYSMSCIYKSNLKIRRELFSSIYGPIEHNQGVEYCYNNVLIMVINLLPGVEERGLLFLKEDCG